MKVSVKDCLQLDIFNAAKVIAGQRNLENRVKGVTVLEPTESKDIEMYIAQDGELVLAGFFGIRDNLQAQLEALSVLAAKGCSALVLFYTGFVSGEVHKELTEEAEKLGLPLIVMPDNKTISYSAVIKSVMEKVLYGDNFSNRLISNTIYHLLNFEKYSSFQAAIREAAINNDFQLILLSEDFNPILSIETRHKATIAEAIRLGKERDVEKSAVYTMIDVNGVLTYWGPVMINGEKHFMFIVDNEDSYSAGEITKLAEIIELAMGMWKYTPERDAKAEFIKALKRGNKSLAYTLKEEANIDSDRIISVFYARGIETGDGTKAVAFFEKEEGITVMKITESEETYGIILANGKATSTGEPADKATCISLFNKLKEEKTVRIFHVTGVDGIEGAGDAYRLIGETWSFVQSVFPYKRVFTKYELALVSNCINIQLQGGYVKRNYLDLLDAFNDMGENKGKQLLETLETFVLDAGMNSAKTSEFMGIHTNTVQYRLKKINEVLGAEITGNRVIPGLTISLALKRLERVVH
ncbi:MAG: PucR family transcriptional regulator [Clostridia bacterium]|nr:PucR family transcriptional regulator [Clostridia bacterium]